MIIMRLKFATNGHSVIRVCDIKAGRLLLEPGHVVLWSVASDLLHRLETKLII